MQLGQHVSGNVELVKEHYIVLSLKGNSGKALAYALTHDFNFRDAESHTRFHLGQGISGTVVALPSKKTGKHGSASSAACEICTKGLR